MSDKTPLSLLRKYWGYDSFRPLQPLIIDSVLNGTDTLGLMPTGGGKSLTFQIPALMLPGITIVVTPLISLMKDQVDNLRERGIPAAALHSGLTRAEHRLAVDRARLGKIKILYLSPEKLQSASFTDSLVLFNVSLIVVDEAHCISQWGYDFRPSYLRIAQLRKRLPDTPVLALTASATPDVADDIMDRLEFRGRAIYSTTFARPNISYIVRHADHKPDMLLRILRNTAGSAIVYVRSRSRSRLIAQQLVAEGISADFYHAGLAPEDKNQKQNAWKENRTRVMVATNAFGMGIDKPDVRAVVHIDLPSSLEEYYQEAGRAGRDGKPAYAVIIAAPSDKATLTRRLNESYPPKDTIRSVYEHACNFLDIAVGSGYNSLYEFNFPLFCERFGFKPQIAHSALMILTNAGYIDYVEEVATRSRVMVTMTKNELYSLQTDDTADAVLQLMLRTYTGLFADYVFISEDLIASRLQITPQKVYEALLSLGRQHAIHYVPRKSTPYIFMTTSRELPRHLEFPRPVYEDMRRRMAHRLDAMKRFVFTDTECRVNTMLRYFGEKPHKPCGLCDVCRSQRGKASAADIHNRILNAVIYLASQPRTITIEYVASQLSISPAEVIRVLRRMMDDGLVTVSTTGVISTVKNQ